MNEEAKKLKTLNQSLKFAKARTEEDFFTEEESLRSAEQSLKNQLKEELHNRTILQVNYVIFLNDCNENELRIFFAGRPRISPLHEAQVATKTTC